MSVRQYNQKDNKFSQLMEVSIMTCAAYVNKAATADLYGRLRRGRQISSQILNEPKHQDEGFRLCLSNNTQEG